MSFVSLEIILTFATKLIQKIAIFNTVINNIPRAVHLTSGPLV